MKPVPTEFTEFVRDVGIRALDRLTQRLHEQAASRRALLRSWSKLTRDDKESLMDELIASAALAQESEMVPQPAPAPRVSKRFDPEEVAATLPADPKLPKKSKRKKSTKKK